MKILKGLLAFLLSLWQFPQHLVGMIVLVHFLRQQRIADHKIKNFTDIYIIDNHPSGVSFGPVVFIRTPTNYFKENPEKDFVEDSLIEDSMNHEYGHSIQSIIFGPLYLFIIGLPSLVHYWLWKPSWKKDYYEFWTEKWADKLGKVNRYNK